MSEHLSAEKLGLRATGPVTVSKWPVRYGLSAIVSMEAAEEIVRCWPGIPGGYETLALSGRQLIAGERYAFRRKTWRERWMS